MEQVLGFSIYIGIALALATICILGLGLTLHLGTRIRKEPLPLLFLAILVATMAMPIATGRLITDGLTMERSGGRAYYLIVLDYADYYVGVSCAMC